MENAEFDNLLKETEALKDECVVQALGDIIAGSRKWELRQELQDKYHRLLLINLEKSIKSGVEMDLWRFTCYNFISKMQQYVAQYKHVATAYKVFLSAATGFFSQLLLELCRCYQRKIRSIPSNRYLGLIDEKNSQLLVEEHFKYMCHFCLVKLGDLARYHSDRNCAAALYQQALEVKPQNGQPYNQLAIISSNTDNDINTLYLHVRSVAISYPFLVGSANLNNFLLKAINVPNKAFRKFSYTLCRLVCGLLYHPIQDVAVPDLCAELLAVLQANLRSAEVLTEEQLIQTSCVLVFLHSECLRLKNEWFITVYTFLADVLGLLVGEAVESTSVDTMKAMLPPCVVLLHWLQKFYLHDHKEIIKANFWNSLTTLFKKQNTFYARDMLTLQKDLLAVATATPEEEMLRYFEPLADKLNVFGPLDRSLNPDYIRLDRLKNVLKWATHSNLCNNDSNLAALRFDGGMSHHGNMPMFISMPQSYLPLERQLPGAERPQFLPGPTDMSGLPYRELAGLSINSTEPSFQGLPEQKPDFSNHNFLPQPPPLHPSKLMIPKDEGLPLNGASLFPGSHLPQVPVRPHLSPELYNPMYPGAGLPMMSGPTEVVPSKPSEQFHFPSTSPFSGEALASWAPPDSEQDLQGIWSLTSKSEAITLQQLLNGKK